MPKTEVTESSTNKYFAFLVEIRKRLLFVISLFVITSVVGFIYYQKIIILILNFFTFKGVNIVFTSPFQFFTLALDTGLAIGVAITIPILVYQFISFLKPALKPAEYRRIMALLPMTIFLFIFGFVYGVAMMRYVVQIFYQAATSLSIGNVVDIEGFFSIIIITGLLMGVAFLFPIIMSILMQLGLVKYSAFIHQRPLAYVIMTIFVILLPPPDLLSDAVLLAPLVILFELTLILNRTFLKVHLLG